MGDTGEALPRTRVVPLSRRRDKPQLSCDLCRRRKLKCDRRQPCDTCQRRNLSCTYPTSSTLSERNSTPVNLSRGTKELQARIHPQELDTSLRKTHTLSPDSTSARRHGALRNVDPSLSEKVFKISDVGDSSPIAVPVGAIILSQTSTTYVRGHHWQSILGEIPELRSAVQDLSNGSGQSTICDSREADILLGRCNSLTHHEILTAVPPRTVVDQLITAYFSYSDIAPVVIHSTTFRKQCELFWARPEGTPIIWVGLLFAVMSLAWCYQQDHSMSEPANNRQLQTHEERISTCLLLGGYKRCPPHSMETLIMLVQIEYIRRPDAEIENWTLLGTIVRLAVGAGYHRDPSNFPSLSIFNGEMRRRVWATISQLDALASARIGLPSMIKASHCNTAPPLNLLDRDLNEEITFLPSARPNNQPTAIQHLLTKTKLVKIYSEISDLNTALQAPPLNEIIRLDRVLDKFYSSNPQVLQINPIARSAETAELIIRRLDLGILYQRARCSLHQRYILAGRLNSQLSHCRRSCIEAALQIMDCHRLLIDETNAGGRLYQERWKVASIGNSSFFLAAALLCVVLNDSPTSELESGVQESKMRERILQTLHISYRVWALETDSSADSKRISTALEFVLEKVHRERLGDLSVESRADGASQQANQARINTATEGRSRNSLPSGPPSRGMNGPLGNNAGAEIDYSETGLSGRFTLPAQSRDDFADMSFGFPRMFAFANDGVGKRFGGTRED